MTFPHNVKPQKIKPSPDFVKHKPESTRWQMPSGPAWRETLSTDRYRTKKCAAIREPVLRPHLLTAQLLRRLPSHGAPRESPGPVGTTDRLSFDGCLDSPGALPDEMFSRTRQRT